MAQAKVYLKYTEKRAMEAAINERWAKGAYTHEDDQVIAQEFGKRLGKNIKTGHVVNLRKELGYRMKTWGVKKPSRRLSIENVVTLRKLAKEYDTILCQRNGNGFHVVPVVATAAK